MGSLWRVSSAVGDNSLEMMLFYSIWVSYDIYLKVTVFRLWSSWSGLCVLICGRAYRGLRVVFWSLMGIGHIQFVLLNGSFCESSPNVLIFPSVSCHNDDRTQPSFVLLGWHMLHFAPPSHDLSLSIPFSFFIPSFSLILYDLHLCVVFWIYCTCYVVFSGQTGSYPPHCHVCLYICANLISVTLTLMCIINSVCVYTLPVPLIYCIVCGSCVHIW